MFDNRHRIYLFCGYYGSGKTNLSMNVAIQQRKAGKSVILFDCDMINSYDCSTQYHEILESQGVQCVHQIFANSNLEAPSFTGEYRQIVDKKDITAVVDLGGDEAGAVVIGGYATEILAENRFSCYYVLNAYRNLSIEDTVINIGKIQAAMRLPITGLVNNSNLGTQTNLQAVLDSMEFVQQVSQSAKLPIVATSIKQQVLSTAQTIPNPYPIHIYTKSLDNCEMEV